VTWVPEDSLEGARSPGGVRQARVQISKLGVGGEEGRQSDSEGAVPLQTCLV